jgi:hypothetical protein
MRVNYKRLFLPLLAVATISFGGFASALEGGIHSSGEAFLIANNYDELVEALADAESKFVSVRGDITLGDNITINKQLAIDAEITFDANGKTVTTTNVIRNGGYNYAFNIHQNMTVTGNGTFNIGGYYGFTTYGGSLTVENGTFNATSDDPYYLFWSSDGDITFNDGEYNSDYIIANNYSTDSKITLKGGTYTSGDWAVINSSNGGKIEINGENVDITTEYDFFTAVDDEPDEYGSIDCVKGTIMVSEESTIIVCGMTEEADEDGEIPSGVTAKLIKDTHITFPKGTKLVNNGTIYVDATSSIKICKDDYTGSEDAIIGEGEISFDCDEEPAVEPDQGSDIDNPATADDAYVYFGLMGLSIVGLFATFLYNKRQ